MQAENWINISISALNYRILLEKNSLKTVDIDMGKKERHENYHEKFCIFKLQFDILNIVHPQNHSFCMLDTIAMWFMYSQCPCLSPWIMRCSWWFGLCVLISAVWVSTVSWIKWNKRKKGENSLLYRRLTFFLHYKQVKHKYDKELPK